jgi:uncharacterized membrane protein (DUF106 family)
MFETLLDPVMMPLKAMPPILAMIVISLIVSLIITIVYKYVTDQTLMKDLKTRQKEYQKKMKALRSEPEKMMKVQKQAMEANMQYMKHSLKPTLITFIPIIIIFAWLNANFAYEPIMPGQEFTATLMFNPGVDGQVTVTTPQEVTVVGNSTAEVMASAAMFKFKADAGNYLLVFDHKGQKYDKEVTISEGKYAAPQKLFKNQAMQSITLSNEKLIVLPLLIFGWKLGWLGTYIIFSIVFSMLLRKVMKIY